MAGLHVPALTRQSALVEHSHQLPTRLKAVRWLGKRTWIPKGQDRLLRMLWNPDLRRHFLFEVEFFGMRYEGDLAEYLDWMVFAYGAFAYSELSLLDELAGEMKRLRGRVNFFDVGANSGHHTLFMAPRADAVFSFEPSPALLPCLRRRIALNNLATVTVVPVALGEVDSVLDYYPGGGTNSGVGSFLRDDEIEYAAPVQVSVRQGDQLLEELCLPAIDLLKIDTEGFEPFVMRGLAGHLKRDRPAVMLEWSSRARAGFGTEASLRELLYPGALLVGVGGRHGCPYRLEPFRFHSTRELLIAPPEMGDLLGRRGLKTA